MATTSLAQPSRTVPEDPRRRRMFAVLAEAEERYRRELMGEEERLLLRERIVRLKTRLAASS